MKLKKLVDSKEAIIRFSNSILPIQYSWELKKFIRSLDPIVATFEETRNQRIKELGEIQGDARNEKYMVKKENMAQYLSEIEVILSKEVEVTIPVIKIGELLQHRDVNGNPIKISPADMLLLDWLIVE